MKQDPIVVVQRKTAQATGCSRAEFRWCFARGADRAHAMAVFDAAVKAGEIKVFTSRKAGATGQSSTRYFSDPAAGREWQRTYAGLQAKPSGVKARVKLVALTEQTKGKAWRNLVQRPEAGPVIVPADVKITLCPSAPVFSRYQLPPGERVIGGFASMGVGRYLDGRAE